MELVHLLSHATEFPSHTMEEESNGA